MKANKVSALRSKRGLHRVRGAEPPVVGLTPQTTNEWKANTMKTYILRQPKPVEPQKATRPPRPKPAVPVTIADFPPRPAATPKAPMLCIGLDVHNDSIAVSLTPAEATRTCHSHVELPNLISNYHVVKAATKVRLVTSAGTVDAKVVQVDAASGGLPTRRYMCHSARSVPSFSADDDRQQNHHPAHPAGSIFRRRTDLLRPHRQRGAPAGGFAVLRRRRDPGRRGWLHRAAL